MPAALRLQLSRLARDLVPAPDGRIWAYASIARAARDEIARLRGQVQGIARIREEAEQDLAAALEVLARCMRAGVRGAVGMEAWALLVAHGFDNAELAEMAKAPEAAEAAEAAKGGE
jgi:hypothetical protein